MVRTPRAVRIAAGARAPRATISSITRLLGKTMSAPFRFTNDDRLELRPLEVPAVGFGDPQPRREVRRVADDAALQRLSGPEEIADHQPAGVDVKRTCRSAPVWSQLGGRRAQKGSPWERPESRQKPPSIASAEYASPPFRPRLSGLFRLANSRSSLAGKPPPEDR
jgi:hypothetical protein